MSKLYAFMWKEKLANEKVVGPNFHLGTWRRCQDSKQIFILKDSQQTEAGS